jgi:hypothetical protein
MQAGLCLGLTRGIRLAKEVHGAKKIEGAARAKRWKFREREVLDLRELYRVLGKLRTKTTVCVFHDTPVAEDTWTLRNGKTLKRCERLWLALDADSLELEEGEDFAADPGAVCARIVRGLPGAFKDCGYVWQATGSAGFKPGARARLWFWLDEPMSALEQKALVTGGLGDYSFDRSLYDAAHIIYTADPVLHVPDPMKARIGWVDGDVVRRADLMELVGAAEVMLSVEYEPGEAPDISRLHPLARKALAVAAQRTLARACKTVRKLDEGDEWNNTVRDMAFMCGRVAWLITGGVRRCEKELRDAILNLNDPSFDASAFRTLEGSLQAGSDCPTLPIGAGLKGIQGARHVIKDTAEPGVELITELAGFLAEDDLDLFVRGGQLVRLGAGQIQELSSISVHEHLESTVRVQTWVARGKDGAEPKLLPPPRDWAEKLWARRDWPGMRELKGITDVPYMRPDGCVISMPGWDDVTGLYYQPRAGLKVKVPERPTKAQGREALEKLAELVADFPFASKRDRMGAIAFTLTLAGRAAIEGPTPLFAFDGNGPGAGKNLLVRVLGYAAGLNIVSPTTWPKTEEELEKRLAAALMIGERLMVLDECARTLQSESVRVITTERYYQARKLGQSDVRMLPSSMVCSVIGNNLTPGMDMPRRMAYIRLEAGIDPTARTGFRYPDIEGQAKRGEYLAAALTVLRAYVCADRPHIELPNLGSYAAWGGLVRAAIVWLGATDPLEGLERELREDSETETSDQEILLVLHKWSEGKPFTARDVMRTDDLEVREAMVDAMPEVSARGIAWALRKLKGRRYRGCPVLHTHSSNKCKRGWITRER